MKLPNKVRGIAAVIIVLAGCTKKQDASIDTGSILQSSFVEPQFMAYFPGQKVGVWSFTPDESYAVVNSAWLPGFFERWKADLHDKGVVGWEGRFDCNKFAASYCAAAQLEYYRDKWGTRATGQALAVGEIWFQPDTGRGHAIAAAITERGVVFIEPQNGKEIRLSSTELASISMKRF